MLIPPLPLFWFYFFPISLPESSSSSIWSHLCFFRFKFGGTQVTQLQNFSIHPLEHAYHLVDSQENTPPPSSVSSLFDFHGQVPEMMARLHSVLFLSAIVSLPPSLDASAGDVDPIYK